VTAYIVRRLGWCLVVLVLVCAITFVIFFAVPGNPAQLIAGKYATKETIALVEKRLGLDQPMPLQFLHFVSHAAYGDWGFSYVSQQPVLGTIMVAFPKTLSLTFGAVLIWLLIGIPAGIVSALKPGSFWDRATMVFTLVGISAPAYWIGILFLRYFADRLGWFPLGDYTEIGQGGVVEWAHHLVLPWITLALLYAGWYARMTRAQMLDIGRLDYVRTAFAKGLPTRVVVGKHIFRNALLPLVTMLGMDVAYLFGGAVLTESVFGIPGIGGLAWRAIRQRDLPMVMGTVLFAAIFIVVANLLVDLLYFALDPRIQRETS
jgi:peptide/nickel transport system permease protein